MLSSEYWNKQELIPSNENVSYLYYKEIKMKVKELVEKYDTLGFSLLYNNLQTNRRRSCEGSR